MQVNALSMIGNYFTFFMLRNQEKLQTFYNESVDAGEMDVPYPIYCWVEFTSIYDKMVESHKETPQIGTFMATATIEEFLTNYYENNKI